MIVVLKMLESVPSMRYSMYCINKVPVSTLLIVYRLYDNAHMNNHIYSTLFKTSERESHRRSKEIEQRKESQKIHTNKTTKKCDPKF